MGSKVLYGMSTDDDIVSNNSPTNGTVIDELISGFTVMSPPLNTINSPSSASVTAVDAFSAKTTCPGIDDALTSFPLRFGYDVSTGCAIRMNR